MVIEVSKRPASAHELNLDFSETASVLESRLALLKDLFNQDNLRDITMDERFEEIFRAHGGTEYAFKQIAAEVLDKSASENASRKNIDRSNLAISALETERRKIIEELIVGARNLEKIFVR